MEVIVSDEFLDWYFSIDDAAAEDVTVAIDILEEMGVALGFPQTSKIHGSSINLRELRIQSQGRPLRVFYTFDPSRNAVVLIGGDKTGDGRFYEQMISIAEEIYERYLLDRENE